MIYLESIRKERYISASLSRPYSYLPFPKKILLYLY